MKKVYTKPMVMIENFELSQHIATCNFPIKDKTQAVKAGCHANVPDLGVVGLFYTSLDNDTCTVDGEGMYCYTNGGSETFVFSS